METRTVDDRAADTVDKLLCKLDSIEDITSDEYIALLDGATGLYKQVVESNKNKIAILNMKENSENEKNKNDLTREIETKKVESNEKVETKKTISSIVTTVLNGILTIVSVIAGIWTTKATIEAANMRFERATAKEFDEPITTLTNKTTVQDGLRDQTKPVKFF